MEPQKPRSFLFRARCQLIGRGFRVSAVSPGPISTPLYGKLGLSAADFKTVSASIQSKVPAGRFGNPSEVAHAVVFLASDESAFTVGSELQIDGGDSLTHWLRPRARSSTMRVAISSKNSHRAVRTDVGPKGAKAFLGKCALPP